MQRSLRLFALGAVVIGLAPACVGGSQKPVSVEHFYDNYKTVVASADKDGYTPYWLGREFTAGGLVFRGPYIGGFGEDVVGGGAQFHYNTTGGAGPLELIFLLYSERAWGQSPQNRSAPPGATQRTVMVGTHSGQLTTAHELSGTAGGLSLQMTLGTTTLLATVPSSTPETPGPQPNPLIDEATFLAVMQNLRPYPQ